MAGPPPRRQTPSWPPSLPDKRRATDLRRMSTLTLAFPSVLLRSLPSLLLRQMLQNLRRRYPWSQRMKCWFSAFPAEPDARTPRMKASKRSVLRVWKGRQLLKETLGCSANDATTSDTTQGGTDPRHKTKGITIFTRPHRNPSSARTTTVLVELRQRTALL